MNMVNTIAIAVDKIPFFQFVIGLILYYSFIGFSILFLEIRGDWDNFMASSPLVPTGHSDDALFENVIHCSHHYCTLCVPVVVVL
jgi:hypothetical protein